MNLLMRLPWRFRRRSKKKVAHNLQAPISQLPPEVLSIVFCHLRDSCLDFISLNQDRRVSLKYHEPWHWSIVIRVCHKWRVSALNTPVLWSHIILSFFTGGRWAQEMCRLSKQTPLNIILHNVDPLGHEIMKHFGRCRILSLYQGNWNKVLPTIDTSHLEYLIISNTPFIFCDGVLHAESLQRLQLHACYVDWKSTLLRRLTHLTLDDIMDGCRLSCSDFVAFLSRIPALEVLHLSGFLKKGKADNIPLSIDATSRTRLQNLKYLHLSCVVYEMAGFLCRVDLPSSCRMSLRTWDKAERITSTFSLILSWLAQHFCLPPPIPNGDPFTPQSALQSLCLHHSAPNFKVHGFFEKLSNRDMLGVPEPVLKFSMAWGVIVNDTILQPFLSSLPLDRLAYLEVSNGPDLFISEQIWLTIFGSIRTIERIFLDSDALPFLQALTPYPTAMRFRRPFPALSSIAYNDSIDFRAILECLQARSASGLVLQEFLFPGGCSVPAPTREKLEQVVSHVGFHSRTHI